MTDSIPVTNPSMELRDCVDKWFFDEKYDCWCLEDVLYTAKADMPKFQRLSIFVPKALMDHGVPTLESRRIPIVFENNAAGYMQMPHTWLGGPRCYAEQYLQHGLIYVTCGCRGRESRNAQGRLVGKAPISLIDLKTALRFLRHNKNAVPGDFDRIISVGWSAGGVMSTLLAVTGDNARYDACLEKNGAFMEESDAVFAAQIYCPIIDLEHADLAYEWCFQADKVSEDCMSGPSETMTPFKEALSKKLAAQYVDYVNSLGLRHPQTGEALTLRPDGRGGAFYDYLMDCLNASAAKFLSRLPYPTADYLAGNYTYEVPAPHGGNVHHAGPGMALDERPMSLGDMMSRPPKGTPYVEHKPEMIQKQGSDKRKWLTWDGQKAVISSLDDYVLHHRRRMKPCTAFDALNMDSGENHVFGSPETDYSHFDSAVGRAIEALRPAYPQEADKYAKAFDISGDAALGERIYLINPMNFIGTDEQSVQAKHYRIRVGAGDADTAFSVSMTLAVKLANAGFPVDYALMWDQPHSEADDPGAVLQWIDAVCQEQEA